jgi:hypothetical protein
MEFGFTPSITYCRRLGEPAAERVQKLLVSTIDKTQASESETVT